MGIKKVSGYLYLFVFILGMLLSVSCQSVDYVLFIDSDDLIACDQSNSIHTVSVAVKRLENGGVHQDRITGVIYRSMTNIKNEFTLYRVDENLNRIGDDILIPVVGKVRALYIENDVCYISIVWRYKDSEGSDLRSKIKRIDLDTLESNIILESDHIVCNFTIEGEKLLFTRRDFSNRIIGSYRMNLQNPEDEEEFSDKIFHYSKLNNSISYVKDSLLIIEKLDTKDVIQIDSIEGLDIENIVEAIQISENILLLNYIDEIVRHPVLWGLMGARYTFKHNVYLFDLDTKMLKKIRRYTRPEFIELLDLSNQTPPATES